MPVVHISGNRRKFSQRFRPRNAVCRSANSRLDIQNKLFERVTFRLSGLLILDGLR